MEELVNKVAELRANPDRLYIISDTCANNKASEDPDTRKRVIDAQAIVKHPIFMENLVEIKAVNKGHKADANEGRTLTSALISVIKEMDRGSIPLKDLQERLREEQLNQNSKNFPKVEVSPKLANDPFPF